ncbi:MAG TPA: hypothetical protein VLA79_14060 [Polyangia bacterium]|nr:hypothetical protein [Polyangia bacterium]
MTRAFGAGVVLGLWVTSNSAVAQSAAAGGAAGAPPVEVQAPATKKAPEEPGQPEHNWKPLRSAEATATSFLQNDWNRYEENYHPSYAIDGNPATAWVEGVKGFGEKETITIPLSVVPHARALRLRIWNGYQKSMHLWTKNAMPENVGITVLGPDERDVARVERTLTRSWGPQEIVIDLPPKRALATVEIRIESVYPGQKFDDTCISDILVDVDSDVPYNAAAEKAKYDALLAWVSRRKEAAAYLASKPAEFPFAFTKYQAKKATLDRDDFKRRFAARDTIAKGLGPSQYQAFGDGSVRVLPDGLADQTFHVEEFAQLLKSDRLALIEAKDQIVRHVTREEGEEQVWTSASRVARSDDQKSVKAVGFDVHDVITERTSTDYKRSLLLTYGQEGRLETLYRTIVTEDEEPGDGYGTLTTADEIWSFSYDPTGKVVSIAVESLQHYHRTYDNSDGRGTHAGRERENKRATRVVFTGVPDKSS